MKNPKEIKQKLIERDGLRCSVTGDAVNSPEDLSVDHIVPISRGGSDDLDNLILVKHNINSMLADGEKRRARIYVQELKKRQDELAARERESFEREQAYRMQIERQKKQLEEFRAKLQKDQSARYEEFENEVKEQRLRLIEQQRMLVMRENETESLRNRLSQEIQERERELALAFENLEREKEKYREESRQKIESKSSAYVNEALLALDGTSKKYHDTGRNWSIAGFAALVAGIATGLYFGVKGLAPIEGQNQIPWSQVVFFAFKGVIVIGLFIGLAKYCFSYGQSFMHEAIKSSERKHAINFGKFYLETYGADAQWSQLKDAFQHWNISSASAFSGNDPDKFDPKIIDKAIQLTETIQKISHKNTNQKDTIPA